MFHVRKSFNYLSNWKLGNRLKTIVHVDGLQSSNYIHDRVYNGDYKYLCNFYIIVRICALFWTAPTKLFIDFIEQQNRFHWLIIESNREKSHFRVRSRENQTLEEKSVKRHVTGHIFRYLTIIRLEYFFTILFPNNLTLITRLLIRIFYLLTANCHVATIN